MSKTMKKKTKITAISSKKANMKRVRFKRYKKLWKREKVIYFAI